MTSKRRHFDEQQVMEYLYNFRDFGEMVDALNKIESEICREVRKALERVKYPHGKLPYYHDDCCSCIDNEIEDVLKEYEG